MRLRLSSLQVLGVLGEVAGHTLGGVGHASVTLVPARGADLPVVLEELECLDDADDLIHVAAERLVVDDLMADDAAQARDIVDNATPKLSKAQYLDFNRSMMATDKFVPEALPMRGAPL